MGWINSVIFAENIQEERISENDIRHNAIHVLTRGKVLALPGYYSFHMLVLMYNVGDLNIESFRIEILNPNGVSRFDTKDIPSFKLQTNEKPNNAQDFVVTMGIMNMVVDVEGEYSFNYYINGDLDYTAKLNFSVAELI